MASTDQSEFVLTEKQWWIFRDPYGTPGAILVYFCCKINEELQTQTTYETNTE